MADYVLRKDNDIWLIGMPIPELPASRIPTKGDVIRLFFYLKDGPMKHEKHVSFNGAVADRVVLEIQQQWAKTGIKIQRKDKVKAKILDLYDNYRTLQKKKGCKSNETKEKLFTEELSHYFFIAHQDAEAKIATDRLRTHKMKTEDLEFLSAVRDEKNVSLGSEDQIYTKKVARKIKRTTAYLSKKSDEKQKKQSLFSTVGESTGQESESEAIDSSSVKSEAEEEFVCHVKEKNVTPVTAETDMLTLQLPKNPLKSEKISTMADRLNLSAGQRTALMAAVIAEGGADLKNVTLSKSSTRRAGKEIRTKAAVFAKASFTAPKYATLHWDGKIVPGDSERLAVLIAGLPAHKEGKLLGVPVIADGTGTTQATVSHALTQEWNAEKNIVGLVFDTTASNSGWKNGACVQLETLLKKKVFYFACRHHVMERILCAVWQELFGETSSPDTPEFKDFQKSWGSIAHRSTFRTLDIHDRRLKCQREIVVSFFREQLSLPESDDVSVDAMPRDDYRESAELMLILLGEDPPRGVHWLQPGAFHHARWMATILYSSKMYAFGEQLNYDQAKMDKLRRMCLFNALFYVKAWLSAGSAADAPVNDLRLWNDLMWYKRFDPAVAQAAMTALHRHLWYLTEEIAPFALFSTLLSDSNKKQVVRQLRRHEDDATSCLQQGVPIFPQLSTSSPIQLSSLVGAKSWQLFRVLQVDNNWMTLPPTQWVTDAAYNEAAMFVHNCKVVNDMAERAVKLITDFAGTITQDEVQRQYLLQTVEKHRREISNFKKTTLRDALY